MKKIIGSLLSYVAIYIFLTSVILEAINWVVNKPTSLGEIRAMGEAFTSWGNHNLLFIFSFVIVNYSASFFCGSIISFHTKKLNLGLIYSSLFILIIGYFYFSMPDRARHETTISLGPFNNNEFPISSWIAIGSHFLTGYFGFIHGNEFEDIREDGKILEISWFHWIWIFIPYMFNPVYTIFMNLSFSLMVAIDFMKPDVGFIRHLLELLLLIPIAISLITLVKFHEFLSNKSDAPFSIKRFSYGFLILFGGVVCGLLSQAIIFTLKDVVVSNFSI